MSLEGSHLLSEFTASWEFSARTCLSGLCAPHREDASAGLSHSGGCSGLGTPKFSHPGAYIWGCLVKMIFFFCILMIICIIFCLRSWQSALQIKEKGTVNIYE